MHHQTESHDIDAVTGVMEMLQRLCGGVIQEVTGGNRTATYIPESRLCHKV